MNADELRSLEREWLHASEIAFLSIGQPDRAANVAYRDQLRAKIDEARKTQEEPPFGGEGR